MFQYIFCIVLLMHLKIFIKYKKFVQLVTSLMKFFKAFELILSKYLYKNHPNLGNFCTKIIQIWVIFVQKLPYCKNSCFQCWKHWFFTCFIQHWKWNTFRKISSYFFTLFFTNCEKATKSIFRQEYFKRVKTHGILD